MTAASSFGPSPSAPSTSAVPTADFGSRFSAFVIDAVLLFAGQWIAFIVLSRQLQAVGLTTRAPCEADPERLCEGPSSALWVLLVILLIVTTIGYYAFFEGRYGATPGKRWSGLRVISLAGSDSIGLTAATLRAVVRQAFWLSLLFTFDASPLGLSLPPVLFIFLPLAALALVAYAAVAADGRGVHDLAAGTQVVRNDQVPARHLINERATDQPAGAEDLASHDAASEASTTHDNTEKSA